MNSTLIEQLSDKANSIIYNIGQFLAKCAEAIEKAYYSDSFGSIITTAAWIWTGVVIVLWLYVFLKFDLEHRSKVIKSKSMDLPEDIPMEKLEFSLSDKITIKSFLATISNLLYKRFFILERLLIPGSNKEEYKLVKNTLGTIGNMTIEEENFQKKLLLALGQNNEIPVTKFTNIFKNREDIEKLNQVFINYKLDAYSTINPSEFYENSKFNFGGIWTFVILGFLVLVAAFKYYNKVIIFGIIYAIFLFYMYHVSKKTQKNVDTKTSWLILKKNLNQINKLNLKEIPDAKLWLKYFSYAYVLGNEDKLYNMIMSKRPKTVGLEEDNLSDYFDELKHVRDTLIEIKKAILICEQRVK